MFEIQVNISAFIASGHISLLKKIPQWQKVKVLKVEIISLLGDPGLWLGQFLFYLDFSMS